MIQENGCSWEKEKSCVLQCSGQAVAILQLTEWQMRESRDHLFVVLGQKPQPRKVKYSNKGHREIQWQSLHWNQVPHLPIKKSAVHQTASLIVSKDSKSFCLYLICANHRRKPHKNSSHSLNRHTKEWDSQRRNWGRECFSRFLFNHSALGCQVFPGSLLAPFHSTHSPLVFSSAVYSFN